VAAAFGRLGIDRQLGQFAPGGSPRERHRQRAVGQNPRLENDLLSSGMIRDLTVTDEGRVFATVAGEDAIFTLTPQLPAGDGRSIRWGGRNCGSSIGGSSCYPCREVCTLRSGARTVFSHPAPCNERDRVRCPRGKHRESTKPSLCHGPGAVYGRIPQSQPWLPAPLSTARARVGIGRNQ
jgi:hypothetical protein